MGTPSRGEGEGGSDRIGIGGEGIRERQIGEKSLWDFREEGCRLARIVDWQKAPQSDCLISTC
jgi:hypothetical protein